MMVDKYSFKSQKIMKWLVYRFFVSIEFSCTWGSTILLRLFVDPQDASKDSVALTFSYDGSTEILNLQLPDYSGVLVDCLQGMQYMIVTSML